MALKKDSRPAYRTGRRVSLANSRCFRHGNDFFCCASGSLCTDTNRNVLKQLIMDVVVRDFRRGVEDSEEDISDDHRDNFP